MLETWTFDPSWIEPTVVDMLKILSWPRPEWYCGFAKCHLESGWLDSQSCSFVAWVATEFAIHSAFGPGICYIAVWHTRGILGKSLSLVCTTFSCKGRVKVSDHQHPQTDSPSYRSSERYAFRNCGTLAAHCFHLLQKALIHCGQSGPPIAQR